MRRPRATAHFKNFPAVSPTPYSLSMFGFRQKTTMIDPDDALAGREREMPVPERHAVLGTPIVPLSPRGSSGP